MTLVTQWSLTPQRPKGSRLRYFTLAPNRKFSRSVFPSLSSGPMETSNSVSGRAARRFGRGTCVRDTSPQSFAYVDVVITAAAALVGADKVVSITHIGAVA